LIFDSFDQAKEWQIKYKHKPIILSLVMNTSSAKADNQNSIFKVL